MLRNDLPVLDVPLDDWLAHLTEHWTVDLARGLIKEKHPWSSACAVGLLVRLGERAKSGSREERLARILSGALDPLDAAVSQWLHALDETIFTFLETHSQAVIHSMLEEARALEETVDPRNPNWVAGLTAWLTARDELACVRWSLARIGRNQTIDRHLATYDERVSSFPKSLSGLDPIEDERLASIMSVNPDAWWVTAVPIIYPESIASKAKQAKQRVATAPD